MEGRVWHDSYLYNALVSEDDAAHRQPHIQQLYAVQIYRFAEKHPESESIICERIEEIYIWQWKILTN